MTLIIVGGFWRLLPPHRPDDEMDAEPMVDGIPVIATRPPKDRDVSTL